jgi:diadenosine tetraphosphate (Ap4A) HIT family hydrolase
MGTQTFSAEAKLSEHAPPLSARRQQIRCEFCDELRDVGSSRFGKLYTTERSRVLLEGPELVAMPTLGQLFKGSVLVLPREHVEAAAMMSAGQLDELEATVAVLERRMSLFGPCVVFEHGARCHTGAGCGIYHAHVHIVPVPKEVSCGELLGDGFQYANSFRSVLGNLCGTASYVFFRDTAGLTAYRDLSSTPRRNFPSQFLRRRLAEYFGVDRPWDWRRYDYQEPWLLDVLRCFKMLPTRD